MKTLKTLGILLVIVAVFFGSMYTLNFLTGPVIEANKAGAANDRLNAVMPGGKSYTEITADLADVPTNVVKVSKEDNGLGFVIECIATSNYTGATPMDIVIGVDPTGVICGIKLVSHSESLIFGADYPSTYIGKDSALAGVDVYAGSTYSSTAFKKSVEDGLGVLISNSLIQAGVKSDAQILEELIPALAPGYVKLTETTVSGNIQKALKASNDAGFAYIITSGETSYLALVNAMGSCKVYNVEGALVTEGVDAIVTEAKAHATANQKTFDATSNTKFGKMVEGATEFNAIALDGYSTIVYATSFKANGETYYGFYSKAYGFEQMNIYIVLDAEGKIVKFDAMAVLFETQYFPPAKNFNEKDYEGSFDGLNGETFTGDNAIIAGATMSTNAVKQATKDAFDGFEFVKGGQN